MFKKSWGTTFALMMLLALSACSKDQRLPANPGAKANPADLDLQPGDPLASFVLPLAPSTIAFTGGASLDGSKLIGVWGSACTRTDGSLGELNSTRTKLQFVNESSFKRIDVFYQDDQCKVVGQHAEREGGYSAMGLVGDNGEINIMYNDGESWSTIYHIMQVHDEDVYALRFGMGERPESNLNSDVIFVRSTF